MVTALIQPLAFPNPPLLDPQGWLVLLHGWGANAQDLLSLAPILHLENWQVYCLEAPWPHPQIPAGKMWYNLEDLVTKPGLRESRNALLHWLTTADLDLRRAVLAGFSQGGAMTLEVGLGLNCRGLVVWSGYLHSGLSLTSPAPPTLMIHGQQDAVVPVGIAQASVHELKGAGISVAYHELNMGHEINAEALTLARNFILTGSSL